MFLLLRKLERRRKGAGLILAMLLRRFRPLELGTNVHDRLKRTESTDDGSEAAYGPYLGLVLMLQY